MCNVEGCDRPAKAKGMCDTHYKYWRRTGKVGQRRVKTLAERFWPKVDKTPGLGPNGDCWEWRAYVHPTGYGQVGMSPRRGDTAHTHRASWILEHGSIPDGMLVLHECDNRLCVNPAHLWLGSHKDNTQDMIAKGRRYKPKHAARGERVNHAKLTEEKVRQMRLDHGLTYVEMSEKYGVSPGTCCKVVLRQTWAHVK